MKGVTLIEILIIIAIVGICAFVAVSGFLRGWSDSDMRFNLTPTSEVKLVPMPDGTVQECIWELGKWRCRNAISAEKP